MRPFPDVDSYRVPVSRDGGFKPLWSHAGDELFFVNLETRELLVASVAFEPRFRVESIEALFTIPTTFFLGRSADFYDIAMDDERFLMARLAVAGEEFTSETILVQNWFRELNERVPVD